MTASPAYIAEPEHRDSLPEGVEIDTANRITVRTFQRVAAQMLANKDAHGAEVRYFARRLAADYRAECERDARQASLEEFAAWLRRGDLIRVRGKAQWAWRVSS